MTNILFDIGLIIIVATMLSYAARWLKQPLLIAYVLAGVIIGPVGFGLITKSEEITILAELGIAFLLFTVGLEIDFKKLKYVGMAVVGGGILQIAITFGVGYLLAIILNMGGMMPIYVGLLIAFSSTMIVTKVLISKDEINTLHGRIMIGVLIVQDLVVILLLPLLPNIPGLLSMDVMGDILIKGLGLFSLAVVLNRFVFPRILDKAAQAQEILFLTAISICFMFIGFASLLGFSIVIGAFIAGLALGNFPYNLEIMGETHALMDFFSIIFFTTLGIQFSLGAITTMLPAFLLLLIGLVVIKPVIMIVMYMIMGYGGRISSMVGLGMGQASEFSFVLAAQGLLIGQLSQNAYSLLISVVVISMVITPYIVKFRYGIYKTFLRFEGLPVLRRFQIAHKVHNLGSSPKKLKNHVVVMGADVMGSKIVNYLIRKGSKFVVVEHNPEKVKDLSSVGVYSVYGDADNEPLLKNIGIYKAKLIVITIPDPELASFVIKKAKRFNSKVKVFCRAYSRQEKAMLIEAGADYVVVPEIVSSERLIERIGKVLK